jgi:hypothetical protein
MTIKFCNLIFKILGEEKLILFAFSVLPSIKSVQVDNRQGVLCIDNTTLRKLPFIVQDSVLMTTKFCNLICKLLRTEKLILFVFSVLPSIKVDNRQGVLGIVNTTFRKLPFIVLGSVIMIN